MKNSWKVVADSGVVAYVWQTENMGTKIWHWSISYSDGSGYRFDWETNRRAATEAAKGAMGNMTGQRPLPRFKREKE